MGVIHRDLSDEELMICYQQGDSLAFDCLYQRHAGRFLSYFRARGSHLSPQDLFQETFIKIHKSRASYNSQYPFLPWAFTIAKHVLIDAARKYKITDANLVHPENWETVEAPVQDKQAIPDFLSADKTACLSTHQKTAIGLRYQQDWSFEEIAVQLKTSPSNVRQMIGRGLKKLAQAWKTEEDT